MKWFILALACVAPLAWCCGGYMLVILIPIGIAEGVKWACRRAVRCWTGPGKRTRLRRA